MKKTIILLALFMLSSMFLSAQSSKGSIEVLFFKENIPCCGGNCPGCKARADKYLRADIRKIIKTNYTDSSVIFKVIKMSDSTNYSLIEKYKAKSQTVVIVKKKKKKDLSMDISDIIKTYVQNQNKDSLELELKNKIEVIKKK